MNGQIVLDLFSLFVILLVNLLFFIIEVSYLIDEKRRRKVRKGLFTGSGKSQPKSVFLIKKKQIKKK